MKELKLVVDNEYDYTITPSDKSGPKEEMQGWPLVGLSIGSFLQFIAMDQQTCILKVYRNTYEQGAFCFVQGTLYNATFGDLEGEEAALEMVAWENVRLNIKYMLNTSDIPKKIEMGLMLLLMESSRRRDEAGVDDRVEVREEMLERKEVDFGSTTTIFEDAVAKPVAPDSNEAKLNGCMEQLKRDMGDALMGAGIINMNTGVVAASYHSSPSSLSSLDMFHSLTGYIKKAFDGDSVDALGRYYILDLSNGQTIASVLFGDYQCAIVFDNGKVALGLFLSVIVPKIIRIFEDAINAG
ncbi:MAG: DUF4388 domain-containing protein [Deltaproteobacteria bacterium]|nr:DUF4388 domain-containing protein [Deltaproteobacteria bacterium]